MPITILVRSGDDGAPALTFDGMQRVVVGRGAGSDVRVPDASVSHRHASVRLEGGECLVTDEGSTNGTFVGQVRLAPQTSRAVRSGEAVRVGRVWLEVRLEQQPATRELAAATRDLALALVSQAMARLGQGTAPRVVVVEGPDRGASLVLSEQGVEYRLGRSADCALPLADADASREHALVSARAGGVVVRDLGAKNGTWLGEARVPADRDVGWRPNQMMRIGKTVLSLEEPVAEALSRLEAAADEVVPEGQAPSPPGTASEEGATPPIGGGEGVPVAALVGDGGGVEVRRGKGRGVLSLADSLVVLTALGVLAASIVGLVWLLRG